ncbi:2-keto-4-pentenoate hydratase/2-oxohepta-3-ene-1,7-dioic acid hydratase in catechol pathway [Rhodococcus wratislaviensis]|uniref:Fumarylacetoacetate hydrolase family protein n=1 Tax=Rhodococcus wratislaviensis TaxID=44752 RepID=A0AB38FJ71_RHOWR|nr:MULTISPECIES: fumarylacetoacetate hydrolase family protein [Rhodococcus]REE73529.1 2-keto-4-pentenoate hydratase/2-oxohepta-3-ene-1,7-dioic acid hydratase in catechol pathway [Rhodococcus wratislaviensis]WAM17327.1 fumarylacetoacetate hydrolase family protein [Rhodococcus sp. JS3073]SPZ41388.1 fumarylacetoacetate hydrolase family protein [Rhodococcus wratislaviensis]
MRIANIDNRAALVIGEEGSERGVDIAHASHGRFEPELPGVYQAWADITGWAAQQDLSAFADESFPIDRSLLRAPSPAPRQVFAVGLNYHAHAAESGFESPTHLPPVFTKYASSFTGPDTDVVIPAGGNVDWEIELVAVIGRETSGIDEADAWSHVAGLTAGQDISERITQTRGPAPQFGLGKSYAGFSPQGPWLVTPDEFTNPDDLELGCTIDGEQVQKGRTRDLIFPVPTLIAALSRTVTLYPGDVIFTGTPAGVGVGRNPQRFLQAGEKLDSWIDGIGQLHQRFVAHPDAK